MNWTVNISTKLQKQIKKLPKQVQQAFFLLNNRLKEDGPEQFGWANYGQLKGMESVYHCHLNKGKPRYVAVWKVEKNSIQVMEVKYVGTHEKVNYKRFG
ncbi:type II toxin-antitoxin system RelE/ParE family toxin [Maridesulfovibrio ferrireducens]|uniref:type II toxin-antitoxin system RelE family toxin n=1 Tax=Maridesulfovibrio ferrireducens TaxID=246191 RepID=UPI001A26BD05|nr:cytotoxic translational repressor of toxin-antitoxin stability system [Maridesulfovibrio ferrireducens]MBI9109887.1 cytotoxic translational repressor of toxin-antitoxin stability system [Maridesulfovibrio ferrireducens]